MIASKENISSSQEIKYFINKEASRLGFSAVGIADALYDPEAHNSLLRWLDSGYQAGMSYMERATRKRYDPKIHLVDARSAIVCAHNYYSDPGSPSGGYVSIYARGENYHDVIRHKLEALRDTIAENVGKFQSRIFVDSSPIGEKALAVKAGIGFIGRNGTLILPKPKTGIPPLGSFHFIGILLTDLEIEPDEPVPGTCGKCRRCIDACPTDAIVADGVIDAAKCISYHTTQNKGEVDDEIAAATGNMIFGCDICQVVCPYNKKAVPTDEPRLAARADMINIDLDELAKLTREEFSEKFSSSAIGDIGYEMFKRSMEIAIRNSH